jgi:hypothetical protein
LFFASGRNTRPPPSLLLHSSSSRNLLIFRRITHKDFRKFQVF